MKNSIFRIGKYTRIGKKQMVASLLLTTIVVLIEVYMPILISDAIDFMVGEHNVNFAQIYKKMGKMIMFTLVVLIAKWMSNFINHKITFSMTQDLRNHVFQKLEKAPLGYFDTHPHGEIVSRMISDIDQIADGLLLGFSQIFNGILTIVLTIYFMFLIHVQLAWVVVILSPLSLVIAKYISKKTYNLFQKQSQIRGNQAGFLNERITNQKTIIALGEEKSSLETFRRSNEKLRKISVKAVFFSSITNPSARFVNNIIYAVVALFGAFISMAGELTIGGITCFLSYANQFMKPFHEISSVMTELQNAIACFERVEQILEMEEESEKEEEILDKVEGKIELKNVNFGYLQDKMFMKDLNFCANSGQKVAIVGPTGCGKTTLINLLMRFYEVNSGEILLDGQNINQLTRKSLRKFFGMVLQDSWIKNGSIRENVKLGKPDATEEEVIEAMKKSMSYSLIQRLPRGMDTIVGNQDGILSEGEKQLISISRIMLLNPPMLILDEATSNIDTRTEAKIQQAFDRLMKGKTSFIVAHRLSTIVSADVILVMKDGKIIEQGKHKELMEKKGFYRELYESQFG